MRDEVPIYPRLDDEALEDALEALGVECRYNLRSSRAELRHEGKDWEPTNDRTVAKLVTTIAKRFSYSVHRGEAPLKYGRDNWNLNFSALLKDREVDPFLLWLEALPQWDRTERIDKYLIEFFSKPTTMTLQSGFLNSCYSARFSEPMSRDRNLMKCLCYGERKELGSRPCFERSYLPRRIRGFAIL